MSRHATKADANAFFRLIF